MFNSTTFSSSRRKLQRANPSGAGKQVRAINFASAAPSKIRGRAEFGLYLRVSAAAIPSSTSRRRVRPILLMLVSNAAEIALYCEGGEGPVRTDVLTAIVDWVERGAAPEALI